VLIPHLGFYRDDWYILWTAQAQGTEGILNLFKGDRPFLGYLYSFDYMLLGKSTINWHIYALLIKCAGGCAFLWLLRMIWPDRRVETTFAALLFMIYPGFYQQANAATFKNLLLSQTAVILSLALTILSVKTTSITTRVLAIIPAVVLTLFYLAIYESMIGLEAVRIILLGYVLRRQTPNLSNRSLVTSTLLWSIPYLVVTLVFVYWRVFMFTSVRRSVSLDVILGEYALAPGHSFIVLLSEYFKDVIETTLFAWSVPFYTLAQTIGRYRDFVTAILLGILAAGLAGGYLFLTHKQHGQVRQTSVSDLETRDFIVLGLLIVMITTVPIIAAGRNVVFGLQWDRYTAQSTMGVAIFMAGFAFYAIRSQVRTLFLLSLIGVGVATQFMSAVYYRDFWSVQRNLWWQLTWRAPEFVPGTTVIGIAPRGYRFAEEYEVWGPLNMIYNPGQELKISGQILYDGLEVDMAVGKQEERNNRNILINRDYGKAVIASVPTTHSCVHLIDGRMLELPALEDQAVAAAAPYSRVDLILTDAAVSSPQVEVFGSEPDQDWCYYFEKMDLARQKQDWIEVIRLSEQARTLDLEPEDFSEWMPLYTAYVNSGSTDEAKQLVKRIKSDQALHSSLCLQMETSKWPEEYDSTTMLKLLCGKGT
jgi:hypothetical protein